MGSNGSHLPLAPLADRELSPQVRAYKGSVVIEFVLQEAATHEQVTL
jgi:hypothetical protein